MSDGVHWLVPFAASRAEGAAAAARALALPQLERLLALMQPAGVDRGDESSLSMPHERVLAGLCGLSAADGQIPWAAWQAQQAGRAPGDAAWAWITPCHWRVGANHVAMSHSQDLQLAAADSQTLLQVMRPYFEQDGISLEYLAPTQWLARGEVFRGLATASLDRVLGRTVDAWLPRSPHAGRLRRLQQEMQMLLYTHKVTEARLRLELLPVNSFWVSGAGALPACCPAAAPAGLEVAQELREAALLADWEGWSAAWQRLDSQRCSLLAQSLRAGRPVALTLCGERGAQTWSANGAGALRRIGSLLRRPSAVALLDAL